MKHQRAFASAIMAALAVGIVIGIGALLTGNIRTLPGVPTTSVSAPDLQQAHRLAGYAAAVITLGMAVTARTVAGWLALVTMIVEIALAPFPVSHATLAPVCFSLIYATGVMNSKSWVDGPRPVPSQWGPLRVFSYIVPVLVFFQIALGAAFRHSHIDNPIWHVLNALIVITLILIPGVFVLRQYPGNPALRPAALAMVVVAGVQVFLGFAVYMVLLMSESNNIGLIITGILHVLNGALTMATSLVFTMQVQRNLIQSKA